MAIASYSDLVTSIGNWMHRSDLASVIPDFIKLAESRLQNDLNVRQLDVATTLTTTGGTNTVALPADFNQARSVMILTGATYRVLDYETPDTLRLRFSNAGSSTPKVYSITGSNLVLGPTPDSAYSITLEYNPTISGLSFSNTTNSVLTSFPEAYLHACLYFAGQYVRDADLAQAMDTLYLSDIDRINAQNWAQMSPASMKVI